MLLHLKHMSENFFSHRVISLYAVFIGQHRWVQQNTSHFHLVFNLGLPQNPKVVILETYQLIPSNQHNFNIK